MGAEQLYAGGGSPVISHSTVTPSARPIRTAVSASMAVCRPDSISDTVACESFASGVLAASASSRIDKPRAFRAARSRSPKGVVTGGSVTGLRAIGAVRVSMRRGYVNGAEWLPVQPFSVASATVLVRVPTMPTRGSRRPPMELFWSKVDRSGPCWMWRAAADKDGYGIFSYTLPSDGGPARQRHVRAHRFSFEIEHGPIPTGRLIMHSCDTPACVNPAHLSIGTALDNNGDAAAKGRTCWGERNSHAKLTPEAVVAIRASSEPLRRLAMRFGVSESAISGARRGRTWRRLPAGQVAA